MSYLSSSETPVCMDVLNAHHLLIQGRCLFGSSIDESINHTFLHVALLRLFGLCVSQFVLQIACL